MVAEVVLSKSKWEPGVEALLACLNPWLLQHWQTQLVAVQQEPYYRPSQTSDQVHQIEFAYGYFNSALHELSHWCIAGQSRRLLPDYGYWYEPDGRTVEQQALFERAEVKPQAIEWHFSQACKRTFRVSIDNLSGNKTNDQPFKQAVVQQALDYQQCGLPDRAGKIRTKLADCFYQTHSNFEFKVAKID